MSGELDFVTRLEYENLKGDVRRVMQEFSKIGNQAEAEGARIDRTFKRVGSAIVGYLGTQQLIGFGKSIVNVRAEFEKFGIVLENTLGSKVAADNALNMVAEFAATTPFQLSELSDSFIRLTNQGFQPTREELVKLGDLASSTGKGFTQLSEAVIDAQTGEFERLKEFGIKASKSGEDVTFTFKEQQTTIKNTASEIRNYILSLGDMEGVAGANAKISESLSGQISNLGDAWDNMLNQIGTANQTIITDGIEAAKYLIENYEEIAKILGVLIATYGAYKAAVIASVVAQKAAVLAGNVRAWFQLARGIKSAKDAQILFNLAAKANPYVLLATAIAGVVTALILFSDTTSAAEIAQERMNDALDRANDELSKEKSTVESLLVRINNENLSREERNKNLQKLIELSPEHLGNLTLENIATKEGTKAIDAYIEATKRKITVRELDAELEKSITRQSKAQRGEFEISDFNKAGYWATNQFNAKSRIKEANAKLNNEIIAQEDEVQNKLKQRIASLDEVIQKKTEEVIYQDINNEISKSKANIARLKADIKALETGAKKSANYSKDLESARKALQDEIKNLENLTGTKSKKTSGTNKAKTDLEKEIDEFKSFLSNYKSEYQQYTSDIKGLTGSRKEAVEKEYEYLTKKGTDYVDFLKNLLKNETNERRKSVITQEISFVNKEENIIAQRKKQNQINDEEEYLKKIQKLYSTYYQKRNEIIDKYDKDILILTKNNDKKKAFEAHQAREKELEVLDSNFARSSEKFQNWLENELPNLAKNGVKALQQELDNLQANIVLIEDDNTEESIKKLAIYVEKIKELNDKIKSLENSKSDKKAEKDTSSVIYEIVGTASQAFENLGESLAKELAKLAESFVVAFETFSNESASASQKASGLISLILQVGNIINEAIVDSYDAEARALDNVNYEIASRIEAERSLNAILRERAEIERNSSAFLPANYKEEYQAALQTLKDSKVSVDEALAGLQSGLTLTATGEGSSWFGLNKTSKSFSYTIDQIINGINEDGRNLAGTLANIFDPIDLFGGAANSKASVDAFHKVTAGFNAALESMGKTAADMANFSSQEWTDFYTILDEGGYIVDQGSKALVNSLRESQEEYQAALEEMRSIISDMAGSLGDSLSDALVDSIQNGTDALEEFGKALNNVLLEMAKAQMQELFFRDLFDDLQKEMEDSMNGGDGDWQDDLLRFFDNLPDAVSGAQDYMESFNEQMQRLGFDGLEQAREASQKGFASMSQDSADELNGRFTAIQGHTYEIMSGVKILSQNSNRILDLLGGIEVNTRHLEVMKQDIHSLKVGIDTINTKGITVKA